MKTSAAVLALVATLLTVMTAGLAADMKEKVRVEIDSVGGHPGMDPGMYVCALGHLHIKGTVQNLADVSLGSIKVAGKAFDAAGKLLGTATASTKQPILKPNEKAEINIEFLTVMGPRIQETKRHEVVVIEAPVK